MVHNALIIYEYYALAVGITLGEDEEAAELLPMNYLEPINIFFAYSKMCTPIIRIANIFLLHLYNLKK